MRRRLFNLLAALSLVMCLAAGTLWVRRDGLGDTFALTLRNRFDLTVVSQRGRWIVVTGVSNPFRLRHELSNTAWTRFVREWQWHGRRPSRETQFRFTRGAVIVAHPSSGAVPAFGGWSGPMPAFELAAPTWAVVSATAVLPFAWLARRVTAEGRALTRWRRFTRGWCTSCGYDLRGSAGGCPECGHGRDEVVQPLASRVTRAIGRRATPLARWSVITAAIGICLWLVDDGSNDFPQAALTARRVLAITGALLGVIAGTKAVGTARATGVPAALVNLGLLWSAFLPRIMR